jgi:hypothetical protein
MQMDGSHNPFSLSAAYLGGQAITGIGTATPDPTALALMGLGLAGRGFRHKKFG